MGMGSQCVSARKGEPKQSRLRLCAPRLVLSTPQVVASGGRFHLYKSKSKRYSRFTIYKKVSDALAGECGRTLYPLMD
eukprot:scaffold14870_cov119-Isochrysis_galbana.AAC.10